MTSTSPSASNTSERDSDAQLGRVHPDPIEEVEGSVEERAARKRELQPAVAPRAARGDLAEPHDPSSRAPAVVSRSSSAWATCTRSR